MAMTEPEMQRKVEAIQQKILSGQMTDIRKKAYIRKIIDISRMIDIR